MPTFAATRYVNLGNPAPAPPYGDWATAATNIQDVIDVSLPGDEIVVTNGIYATGGRAVHGTMGNRVVVDKPLLVRSVNGPEYTTIKGYQLPNVIWGDGTFRCVYLTNGAVLVGFTLMNGATRLAGDTVREQSGGGLWCESTNVIVSNCVVVGNWARQSGGGVTGGTLIHCTLTENFASYLGGGAHGGNLNRCNINNNTTGSIGCGGGSAYCELSHCTLTDNQAEVGGGAFRCNLRDCTLTGNRAAWGGEGGGARDCTLNNCLLRGNSARGGGGADQCDLNNCTLIDNRVFFDGWGDAAGGGAKFSTLKNCTLALNHAASGGGLFSSTAENCIVYYNFATNGANYAASVFALPPMTLQHCCTTPLPTNGVGNITHEPLFELYGMDLGEDGVPRLKSTSPCINAGRNAFAPAGPDLDGLPRIAGGTVDIGAFEFQTPASTLSYAWLLQHDLPLDGSADSTDPDGDHFSNEHEWRAGTEPFDPASVLKLLSISNSARGLVVTWQSVPGRSYGLIRSTNLALQPPFLSLATGILGQTGTTSFTDTNAERAGLGIYRVVVQ